jgi:hypothetical protein
MKQIMDTQFSPGTPFMETAGKINQLHQSFVKMGTPDFDKMHCAWLVNVASQHFCGLQSSLQALTRNPTCTPHTILTRLQDEDNLHCRRSMQGFHDNHQSVALLTRSDNPLHNALCTNCKRLGHTFNFCIHLGGKMAGCSIDKARTAQAHTFPHQNPRASAHLATETDITNAPETNPTTLANNTSPTTTTPMMPNNVVINGVTYAFVPVTSTVHTNTPSQPMVSSPAPQSALLIDTGESWNALVTFKDNDPTHATYTTNDGTSSASPSATPFILDTGTTCHISLVRSDFRDLHSIPPRAIKGLGNSSVFATAMGTIELPLPNGTTLFLFDVLYILNFHIRLLSVLTLNRHHSLTTHFDANYCWIADTSGSTIASGILLKSRNLYALPILPIMLRPPCPSIPDHALISQVMPDLETWHHRLSHCNVQTVIDMAHTGVAEDMPIDLSTLLAKCVACILGKQVHTTIPKL